MKILDRFWASSTHNKIAVALFLIGAFIGALILTVHFNGIGGGAAPDESMELAELWVGVGFFWLVALAVKWDERRLKRQHEKAHPHRPPEK